MRKSGRAEHAAASASHKIAAYAHESEPCSLQHADPASLVEQRVDSVAPKRTSGGEGPWYAGVALKAFVRIQAMQRPTLSVNPSFHRRDSVVCSEPAPASPHFHEHDVVKVMSNDSVLMDEDGLLHLDGEEALLRRARSNTSIDEHATQSSSAFWKEPEQGVIILDWDDTLFATSWLGDKSEFKSWQRTWVSGAPPKLSEADARDFAELDKAARAFICAASALGRATLLQGFAGLNSCRQRPQTVCNERQSEEESCKLSTHCRLKD